MLASSLLALLPLAAAFQVPKFPTAQDALSAADNLLHGHSAAGGASTVLSPASDLTLSSISGDDHVTLTSALHPKHKMRIKSHHGWCDPWTKSYSGYLDVGDGRDLFFYFFESRSDPSKDPVVMWINGGPGCSSSMGLFMELGPCTIKSNPTNVNDTKPNPYSWNEKANIFFLEEPLGVGFSEAEHGQTVSTTEEAAIDVQAFVHLFFEHFKEFEGRAFHMSGESYGGRYLPVFASAVHDGNKALIAAGKAPINLKSVLIGNGMTNFMTEVESYYPYSCTIHGGLDAPISPIKDCVEMAEAVPRCHKMAKRSCVDSHDYTECAMAETYCSLALTTPFANLQLNPYDVKKSCTPQELKDYLCYAETGVVREYLDLPEVRSFLGVHPNRPKFSSCDKTVGQNFHRSLDATGQTWLYSAGLLERGIRTLIYVGTQDWICNHIGNEMWTEALEWTGQEGYNAESLSEWIVDGKVAGSYKTYGPLTHLKVLGAGHMVPMDRPKQSLSMLHTWLSEESFGDSK
ncbi:Alpha/Beta hydrolase protein [Kockovaella imperatae]|uniref:Carboxypeptidase n=1 Tax=Kockovaella imperatae TaxID=4999 RepID=A0A1Y1UAY5_9TREE|nr:Alpha/Beta hydrolase protein [Kockovaella imperatae]ORX34677.1 Alpha/Beta hydrolase protein [Kockovaella imperatae]